MTTDIITADGEILTPIEPDQSLAIGLQRAEIDIQVATARKYPRSIDRASKAIATLATLDEEAAQECIFALPRGGKPISGPSVRFAEIVAQQWGNNRSAARVVHTDRTEKFVEAEGVFLDLETNSAVSKRVKRRIVDSKGRLYSDDMIIMTGNAAGAIALRNAILAGVPKGVWHKAEMKCREVIAGTLETLTTTREKAIKAFAHFGIKPDTLFEKLEVKGIEDVGLEHVVTLRGMFTALKNGESNVEEMFSSKAAHEPLANPLAEPKSEVKKEEVKETAKAEDYKAAKSRS